MNKCVCEECPEWPLSMADMTTNLLCFFVLLVSMSTFDTAKFQAISDSMGSGMGGSKEDAVFEEQADSEYKLQKTVQIIMQDLNALFGPEEQDLEFHYKQDAVAINLKGSGFFKPGGAEFSEKAIPLLERVASTVEGIPFPIAVEGHTDNIPTQSGLYPSNWELSGARAAAVANYFISKGMPREQVSVVARADTEPLVTNDTEMGREMNRRIVILMYPF